MKKILILIKLIKYYNKFYIITFYKIYNIKFFLLYLKIKIFFKKNFKLIFEINLLKKKF